MKLEELLARHQKELENYIAPRAGWLLRYESVDDLAQGVRMRAIERGGSFRYEGDAPFFAWLNRVAQSYLADRANYWSALKRKSAGLLRLTAGGSHGSPGTAAAATPISTMTGPETVAHRKELLTLAVQVLAALPERDARMVRWSSEGIPLQEQAERLDISYEAAKKAGQRALDRFREAYRFASGF
ncbi:MAG: sigma-70 family RNA polymerase sigma factor [Planctomycetota bacterium]|jgi:RNA polymerase sigma factor (sigma-70 family)